ncbi:hypothetical protein QSV34_15105 [Porticoccus sp. W117]|uniref:hypothetical protein n=1 Tax=Porticoccus sp. W117 TaxID=3054777 RepID=UPI002599C9D2|nr:hypothetical protein [Porticoccus sp. W117]MDM3872679.1 hypothetical protein [Porticoccus sp. W117]
MTFDSDDLNDCKYKYAYFKRSVIGDEQGKAVYSMALSAFHTGQTVSIVIDKQDPGEYCDALSMDMRKAPANSGQ